MSVHLPSKAEEVTMIRIEITNAELHHLRDWINSLPEPKPDDEQAVRMIVRDYIKKLVTFGDATETDPLPHPSVW